ncbi:hypothetical protein O181_000999 [Austropuccinia psidii MF-1]|uniref:Transcription factor BYE1 n=1 Tax=Austropuccinia psidii MF-1 TaxID=1389203 RepID=A0A9Q3B9L8_9BASI|nr:hypothetical protein [Austropuccinia psidii MF-1]
MYCATYLIPTQQLLIYYFEDLILVNSFDSISFHLWLFSWVPPVIVVFEKACKELGIFFFLNRDIYDRLDKMMTRSNRIRKPSQKAREIAEATLSRSNSSSSVDPEKGIKLSPLKLNSKAKKSSTTPTTVKIKIGGNKAQAAVNLDGNVDAEDADSSQDSNQIQVTHDEGTLYCICLGRDDHTPMIQCEGCENWFHFSCIRMDPSEAKEIEKFYCQDCQTSGTGFTRKLPENDVTQTVASTTETALRTSDRKRQKGVPENSSIKLKICNTTPLDPTPGTIDGLPSSSSPNITLEKSPQLPITDLVLNASKTEPDQVGESTGDEIIPGGPASVSPPPKLVCGKRRKAEELSEEENNEENMGDESLKAVGKKSKTSITTNSGRPTFSRLSSCTPSANTMLSAPTALVGVEKTRKACIEQFFKLFEPLFSKRAAKPDEISSNQGENPAESAMRFSEAVEAELLEGFGEADIQNQKAPRRQYMTKLRSLIFNFKHNPAFLDKLSPSDLNPKLIVYMSHQDLQTPEQKALADKIRQQAIHQSVKISTLPTGLTNAQEKAAESIESADSPKLSVWQDIQLPSPSLEQAFPNSYHTQANPTQPSTSPPLLTSLLSDPRVEDQPAQLAKPSDVPACSHIDPNPAPTDVLQIREGATPSQISEPISKNLSTDVLSSFDLEKVFAAIRSVPSSLNNTAKNSVTAGSQPTNDDATHDKEGSSDDSMDLENTPELETNGPPTGDKQLPEDYDPFAVANGVDADLEAILHGDQPSSPTVPPNPTAEPSLLPPTMGSSSAVTHQPECTISNEPIQTPVLWKGNVMTSDAGGFAACAIQVGGRPLSTDIHTWSKLISSDTMTVVGRLPVKDSTNYLVQSHFAASRELVLLELVPNLQGPPELPSPERVVQHQQNLIEFFTKKGRHAVVAVNEKVKQTVRDIYLVPLLRQEPLPEFVQLLDDVSIPESTPRAKNMMLAVLVLQKGAVPSSWRPNNAYQPGSDSSSRSQLVPILPSNLSSSESSSSSLSRPTVTSTSPIKSSSQSGLLQPFPAPVQNLPSTPLSSSATDPIPLLQSITSKISSAVSSANPKLSFSLLSQLPLPISSTASGPPPGFVPYVSPQTSLPSIPSPNPNVVDLSNVDVSALQALLSNPQALKPASTQSPSPAACQAAPSAHNTIPPPQNDNPTSSIPAYGSSSNALSGLNGVVRPATLPPTPRPANLPPNPTLAHHRHAQRHHQPWLTNSNSTRLGEPREKRKGLMRIGEVLRGNDERRRSGGRSKRMSQEFIAPSRDEGWAGRGRGRGSTGIGGGRSN